jgi:hypothetical protein
MVVMVMMRKALMRMTLPCGHRRKPNFGLSGALAKDVRVRVPPAAVACTRRVNQTSGSLRAPNHNGASTVQERPSNKPCISMSALLIDRPKSATLIQHIRPVAPVSPCYGTPCRCRKNETVVPPPSCQPTCRPGINNGTFLNGVRIDAARYYRCRPKDVFWFGRRLGTCYCVSEIDFVRSIVICLNTMHPCFDT